MATTKAHMRATLKWEKENYFRTQVRVNKDLEPVIRKRAEEKGLSLNGYIASLIKADLEKSE